MFASALLPLGLAGLASASQLFNRQTQACSSGLHVIATAGANSTDPYSYGLLGSLASSIVAAVPGSDMVSMPYNKTLVNAATTTAGEVTFVQYINEYHAACPQGKIALVGYSSGAIITMSGICQATSPLLSQDLSDTIVATVVYGDPTRVAGQPYDLGTCTGNGNLTRLRNPALCGSYIPGLQSYCDTNDPQCCDGPPADFQIHFVYPSKYDQVATQWVVQRYNAAVGGNLGTNSSSSSSSSSTSSSSSSSTSSSTSSTTSTSSSSSSSSSSSAAAASSSSSSAPPSTSSSASSTASKSSSATPSASASLAPGSNGGAILTPAVGVSFAALFVGAVAAFL